MRGIQGWEKTGWILDAGSNRGRKWLWSDEWAGLGGGGIEYIYIYIYIVIRIKMVDGSLFKCEGKECYKPNLGPYGKTNLLAPAHVGGKYSVYCRHQTRRTGSSWVKIPKSLMAFRPGVFFRATFGVRAAGCVIFLWLVGGDSTGWCSGKLIINLLAPSSLGPQFL